MIVQDGRVVLEEYFRGSSRVHAHQMRSASKSVGSVLLGIAIDRGDVTETHKIADIFQDYTIQEMSPDKTAMTVQDVLTMRSGLAWKQWGHSWADMDGKRMWESDDHIQYTLDRPMAHPPGQVFHYSDGVSTLLGGVIDATTGMSARAFADAFLFAPLGITSAAWWGSDKQGHIGTGWGLKLTTPDMARFGLLMLHEGKWDERQIVSSAYLRRALTMSSHDVHNGMSYGYQWWGLPVTLRGQASHIYGALGLGGQQIWIVPPLRAVIVVTAWERNRPGRTLHELLTMQLLPALAGTSAVSVTPSAFGFLGVSLKPSATPVGVLIDQVIANSPAAQGGLRVGDVIVRIDGETVGSWNAAVTLIRVRPGKAVDVAVVRAGELHTRRVTLGTR